MSLGCNDFGERANRNAYLRQSSCETAARLLCPIIMRRKNGFRTGFTLIELLVVIAIIGILASMTVVVIAKVRERGRKAEAQREIRALFNAITEYHADTGSYPVSSEVLALATAAHGDFTFGGAALDGVFGAPGPHSTSHSEVMAILMDRQRYPAGAPTVNFGHAKNTRQKNYLTDLITADATNLPGLGPDLVFRDPWGNPYVITFDLNFDENCQDVLYARASVSREKAATGFNGLFNAGDATGNSDEFRYRGGVMIWSLGPDKKADTNAANAGVNKDNVLSWK